MSRYSVLEKLTLYPSTKSWSVFAEPVDSFIYLVILALKGKRITVNKEIMRQVQNFNIVVKKYAACNFHRIKGELHVHEITTFYFHVYLTFKWLQFNKDCYHFPNSRYIKMLCLDMIRKKNQKSSYSHFQPLRGRICR